MKAIVLLFTSWLFLVGCSKQVSTPEEDIAKEKANSKAAKAFATVQYSGTFEQGGYGWILRMTDQVFEVPINLPSHFAVDGMRVFVVYQAVDKVIPCKCNDTKYYVEIVEIEKASKYNNGR